MSRRYFLAQEATSQILLRVTNVCGECYHDLIEGEIIHYDMQTYRYLCTRCQEEFSQVETEEFEVFEEKLEKLF